MEYLIWRHILMSKRTADMYDMTYLLNMTRDLCVRNV